MPRMKPQWMKSCGHHADEDCSCPVVDEVWTVPPAHSNCRSSLTPEETYDKVARALLASIERKQKPQFIIGIDGRLVPRGRKNGKGVRGQKPVGIIMDEICEYKYSV